MNRTSSRNIATPFSTLKTLFFAGILAALPIQQAAATFMTDIYSAGLGGIGDLATAEMIVSNPANFVASGTSSIIEFDDLGDGTTGNFGINNPWPGGVADSFAALVTGTISTGTGMFEFGLNHDDGARLLIDSMLVASADGVADNRDTTGPIALTAGLHSVEILFFENFGGASLEFFEVINGQKVLVPSVPEPSTLALLSLGFIGIGAARKLKKH